MKKLLFSLVFLFGSLCLLAQEPPVRKIQFESFTRGYQKKVEITRDSIQVEESGTRSGSVQRAISKAEWEQLMATLEGVKPKELPQLGAGGKERARDAALHSTLTLITESGSYTTPTFDNYRAHPALAPLMEVIRQIEEKGGRK